MFFILLGKNFIMLLNLNRDDRNICRVIDLEMIENATLIIPSVIILLRFVFGG
jgi:hypothetical protein